MPNKYPKPMRDILFASRDIASAFHSPTIESEHMLLAIARLQPSLIDTCSAEGNAQAKRSNIRIQIEPQFKANDQV